MSRQRTAAQTQKAPVNSPSSPPAPVSRAIDLALLLEPKVAARETFDEAELEGLIHSIASQGVINALAVEQEGEMFRVIAGHRRLVACKALKLSPVPCRVWAPGTCSVEALKAHENAFRENLNAAQEARHFGQLLDTECQHDVDKLCELVQMTRDYVEGRLILLRGDPDVLTALGAGAISIGVATELNKVADRPRRMMYLDCAMQGGASVRMVKDWRKRGNMLDEMQGEPAAIEQTFAGAADRLAPVVSMQCFLCDDPEDVWDLELLYVHRRCRRIMLRQHPAPEGASDAKLS